MAYRFSQEDGSVARGMRRVAGEQVDRALAAIAAARTDPAYEARSVHEVRKSCKKLRALVRLVRPSLAGHREADALFAELAGGLAGSRDAHIVLTSFDRMTDRARGRDVPAGLPALRAALEARLGAAGTPDVPGERAVRVALEQAGDRLAESHRRIARWHLSHEGWDALGKGVERTLVKARRAHARLAAEPAPEARHELRKRLKYNWYHTRLLVPLWPGALRARAACLSQVADDLGEHHDLFVMCGHVRAVASAGDKESREVAGYVLHRSERRQRKLERRCDPDIARLLVRKPSGLANDWGRLWPIAMDR